MSNECPRCGEKSYQKVNETIWCLACGLDRYSNPHGEKELQLQISNLKAREQKLLGAIDTLKSALRDAQRHGILHYTGCMISDIYKEIQCDCGAEKTEKVMLDAFTKVAELENELR